jgi:CheY-like chemotaxis protein
VISDIVIPGLDGRRLSRAIREDPSIAFVAVLLIGGDGALADGEADGFLPKPFNGQQLLTALATLTTRHKAPRPASS